MLDGNAFPQPQSRTPDTAAAGRFRLPPHALQAALIVVGIVLVTFVLYLYVLPNSQIDAARVRIADLQARKAMLERQNSALLQEIALASNLKTLEVRAKALGMGPARNTIYLRLPGSSPAAAVGAGSPRPAADDAAVGAGSSRPAAQDAAVGAGSPRPAAQDAPATLSEWLQRDHLENLLRQFRQTVSHAVDQVLRRLGALP